MRFVGGVPPVSSVTLSLVTTAPFLYDGRPISEKPFPLTRPGRARTGQSSGRPRRRFVWLRRFLSSSRRRTDALLGLVGRRFRGGGAIASRSSTASRSRAASRLRHCDLNSEAAMVTTPSTSRDCNRSSARALSTSLNADVLATSKLSSTRLSVVFTDCPPGPLDRENRHPSPASGITTPDRTSSPLSTPPIRPEANPQLDACVVRGQSARCAQEDAAVAFLPLPSEEIAPGHTLVVPRRIRTPASSTPIRVTWPRWWISHTG